MFLLLGIFLLLLIFINDIPLLQKCKEVGTFVREQTRSRLRSPPQLGLTENNKLTKIEQNLSCLSDANNIRSSSEINDGKHLFSNYTNLIENIGKISRDN